MENNGFNKNMISARTAVFCLAMSLWIMSGYLSNSYYAIDYAYWPILGIKYISLSLFVLQIFLFSHHIKIKTLVGFVSFFCVVILAAVKSGTFLSSSTIVVMCLIFLCGKDLDFRSICKCIMWNEMIWMIIIIVSAKIGIITEYISIYEHRERNCLGATYPGFLPISFINIMFCCFYVYLYNKESIKKHWYIIIALIVVNTYFYNASDVRQTFYITIVAIILLLLINLFGDVVLKLKLVQAILMVLFPLLCCVTYIMSYKFRWDDPIMWLINNVFSGRLQYNNVALKKYGLHLLGSKVTYNTGTVINNYSDYFFIDSGYVETGIRYGIILLVVLICIYMMILKKAIDNREYVLIIWIALLAVYNMFNNMMFSVTTNSSIFAIWGLLNMRKDKRIKKI